MRILVTGATGLVGNNCVRMLHEDHDVHVLIRPDSSERPLKGLRVTRHFGDLSQPKSLATVIPQVDTVVHAAGDTHIGIRPRPSQHVVNTLATKAIADVANSRHIRLVFVSSVDALPAAATPNDTIAEETQGGPKSSIGYVQTKREAEFEILHRVESGLNAVIVNPGFMLGPWDWKPSSGRMLLEVASRFMPFAPRGGCSLCDVRDVSQAICRIATEDTRHRRYILAGHNMTYVELWRVLAEVSQSRPPIGRAGPLTLRLAGLFGDSVARLSGREGDINSGAIGMANLLHYYDSSRAEAELEYQIRPVRETVLAAWSWFQQHGFAGKTG